MIYELLSSQKEELTLEQNFDSKTVTSKMASLNSHLKALLQKKIRIDLEIRRTKKKLSKMKNRSSTYVKTTVSLEGFNLDYLTPELNSILEEKLGPDKNQDMALLLEQIQIAETLEQEASRLPLYEE